MEHFYTTSLFDRKPPPPPPQPPYFIEDNVPDILVFMGFTVYGVSLFFAMTDILEQDYRTFADLDYSGKPVFLIVGLMLGLLSYGLAFLSHISVGCSGHSIFTTLVFAMFAKHLTRRAEMSNRKASTVITLGSLPLISLAVLEAGKVRVRSAKFFFALMMVFSAMPLGPLFREWLPGSSGVGEPAQGKLRKRIFCLFFFAFVFVAASTPTSVTVAEAQVSEARQSIVVFFDLVMIYYALDGLWMGAH